MDVETIASNCGCERLWNNRMIGPLFYELEMQGRDFIRVTVNQRLTVLCIGALGRSAP